MSTFVVKEKEKANMHSTANNTYAKRRANVHI